jgi:GNAT superfamily N-acetyltransferase
MPNPKHMIVKAVDPSTEAAAIDLLNRFFAEESFDGNPSMIAGNLSAMLTDDNCWAALAVDNAKPVGIITASLIRDIEYGRVAEFGDLYVLPEARGRGVAQALVSAGKDWCKRKGCAAILLTITAEGDAAHGLTNFYKRFGFQVTGRMVAECRL